MHAADPPVPLQHADVPAGSTAVAPADVPADLQGLAELTIVVPTYQRPDALARLMAYCAPLPLQLVVVDGSAEPAALPALQASRCGCATSTGRCPSTSASRRPKPSRRK